MRGHWHTSPLSQIRQRVPGASEPDLGQAQLAHLLAVSLTALLTAIALLVVTPRSAGAVDVRADESIDVSSGETLNDDLYAFGRSVQVRGTVNGDVISGAADTTVSGVITGDLIASGGTITITGRVDGSVRVAGGTIRIEGPVGEDLVAGAGAVEIGPSGRIGRDALLGVGATTIDGQVGRNVQAGAGKISVNGTVGGDLRAQVDTLTLGPRAIVGGTVVYASEKQAEISSGATVRGPVEYQPVERERPAEPNRLLDTTIGWIRTMVGLSALGLLLVLLVPGLGDRATASVRRSPWASIGVGLMLLIVWPLLALLIFGIGLVVGGWWLGLILLALYTVALFVGYVVAGLLIGRLALARVGRVPAARVLAVLLGLAVLTLAGLIPIVGGLVTLVAVLVGLGALALVAGSARGQTTQPALV